MGFDWLVGSIGQQYNLLGYYPQQMANAPYIPQYYPVHVCIHGINCPKCREEIERNAEIQKEQNKKIAEKKKEYEERCREYMKRFEKGHP